MFFKSKKSILFSFWSKKGLPSSNIWLVFSIEWILWQKFHYYYYFHFEKKCTKKHCSTYVRSQNTYTLYKTFTIQKKKLTCFWVTSPIGLKFKSLCGLHSMRNSLHAFKDLTWWGIIHQRHKFVFMNTFIIIKNTKV
jgi:hypothetical protein